MNDSGRGVNEPTMVEKVRRGAGWLIKFPARGTQTFETLNAGEDFCDVS